MEAPKTMDEQDWGLLILLSVLWGGAYFFAGVAVKELPPLTVVLARVFLAAVALLPLFWYFGHSLPKSFSGWLPFFGMGLLNNVLPFGFTRIEKSQNVEKLIILRMRFIILYLLNELFVSMEKIEI